MVIEREEERRVPGNEGHSHRNAFPLDDDPLGCSPTLGSGVVERRFFRSQQSDCSSTDGFVSGAAGNRRRRTAPRGLAGHAPPTLVNSLRVRRRGCPRHLSSDGRSRGQPIGRIERAGGASLGIFPAASPAVLPRPRLERGPTRPRDHAAGSVTAAESLKLSLVSGASTISFFPVAAAAPVPAPAPTAAPMAAPFFPPAMAPISAPAPPPPPIISMLRFLWDWPFILQARVEILTFSPPLGVKEVNTRDSSAGRDRKSTRLNSSHGYISYAVFCLKKKKKNDVYSLND